MRVLLIFPPGWTLATGSPHLGLPLLCGFLDKHGLDVTVRDLNWEAAHRFGVGVNAAAALQSCRYASLGEMNEPYFRAEDVLMDIAAGFNGRWNAQLGFEYSDSPQRSS